MVFDGISQAAILVGGRGERLGPFTDNTPKPMVMLCGKPFLEHLLILLKSQGIVNLLFMAGYLGGQIKKYFSDGSRWGVKIDYSFEESPMGTGGALKSAADKLEERFFLLFGDSYLPVNYLKFAEEHLASKKQATLAIYDNQQETGVPYNIAIDKNKKVISRYDKRRSNPQGLRYCDAGAIALNKGVVSFIEKEKTPVSFEDTAYSALIARGELSYYMAGGRFYDIGTVERLKDFENYILTAQR